MARPRLKLLGKSFGHLTVVADAGSRRQGHAQLSRWKVRCVCGTEKVVTGSALAQNKIRSCGCLRWAPRVPSAQGKSWCGRCRKLKPKNEFYRLKSAATGCYPTCIVCYRNRTPEEKKQLQKNRRLWARRQREEAVAHYGGACACCGEEIFEFLALDHINGGGRAHRKKINTGNMAWWLKKQGYPKGYRVLCHNCNMARGVYGFCPHERRIYVG